MEPVFIIGAPRSGTTIFMKTLSAHPQVAWMTGICIRYPARPQLNRTILTLMDMPVIGPLLSQRLQPWEGYDFWEYHCPGFRRPFRDLTADDVTCRSAVALQKALNELPTRRRPKLVMKITGWPRIGFLRKIFPKAKFIHLIRDGRAVANSLLHNNFWRGWQGPEQWRWGSLSPNQASRWQMTNNSFAALAGLQWEILINAIEIAQKKHLPSNYLEIRYEQMCAEPTRIFKQVLAFIHLPELSRFLTTVKSVSWENQNERWLTDLTGTQQQDLEKTIKSSLISKLYL